MGVYNPAQGWTIQQADYVFTQAAPVQNTWYTWGTLSLVELHGILVSVATANETLEFEATIDGQMRNASQAATAGTWYIVTKNFNAAGLNLTTYAGTASKTNTDLDISFFTNLRCSTLTGRIRKTTALGAGDITVRVVYGIKV
jgi:hypothetical protein